MRTPEPRRWNHNIHYHRLILDAVPQGARTALDVGTGNGLLAIDLRERVPEVTGLDLVRAALDTARRESAAVTWVQGDFMNHPFSPGSFDVVASVATLHHLDDLDEALSRFANLTAPGGVVAIVGLARSSRPIDWVFDVLGMIEHRQNVRRFGLWEHSAPTVWPPPHTYAEAKRSARRVLPGAQWRRLPMWRYALVWNKPL